jgi:large subunit ribosomal protein L21
MFAVIQTGGKQYLVQEGQTLKVERISGEKGQSISFDKVLLIANEDGTGVKLGKPTVAGATVQAEVLEQARAKKVLVIKYKRKVRYSKKQGHRQYFTKVKIVAIK